MPHWSDLSEKNFNELLRLTRMYHREARRCEGAKSYLAGCIMAGAALEALLVAMLHLYGDELEGSAVAMSKGRPKPLLGWTLFEMLNVARNAKWLPTGLELGANWNTRLARIGDYAEVLRQIRNLIHPSRYLLDQSPSRITKRYLTSSIEIFEAASSHLEAKVHESLRKDMEKEKQDSSS